MHCGLINFLSHVGGMDQVKLNGHIFFLLKKKKKNYLPKQSGYLFSYIALSFSISQSNFSLKKNISFARVQGILFFFSHWQLEIDHSNKLLFLGEGNGNPLQYSCLENPRDGRAWWAAICGVVQSQT